jgi:hypothetical protein
VSRVSQNEEEGDSNGDGAERSGENEAKVVESELFP